MVWQVSGAWTSNILNVHLPDASGSLQIMERQQEVRELLVFCVSETCSSLLHSVMFVIKILPVVSYRYYYILVQIYIVISLYEKPSSQEVQK